MVLAGGLARRLGGVDKPGLVVGTRPMLDTVLLACAGAWPLVVVGEPRPAVAQVLWTREDPPHGGPVAGLAAGLAAVPPDVELIAVLAADLPRLRPATVRRLLDALERGDAPDGALLVDRDGHPQWLVGAWRTAALRARLVAAGEATGSMRALLGALRVATVGAVADEAADVDTPADLAAHSRHTGGPVT